MANIKFSGFTEVTNISGIQEIVGYNGTQNVRITPANFLSSLPGGPFLPLAGGTMTGSVRLNDSVTLQLGTSTKTSIYNDGTDTYIQQTSGNLYLWQSADDKDIIFASDNGAGGVTEYFRVDGGAARTIFTRNTVHVDNTKAIFGNGDDLQLTHDGFDSYINNFTGDLDIVNLANDKDILFRSDDGSGGTETYFFLDGSLKLNRFLTDTLYNDNVEARFGTSTDLKIYHDGTNSAINNLTGDLYIMNASDDKDIFFQSDNGSGGLETYLSLDGSDRVIRPGRSFVFPDNISANFGAGYDLNIKHDGGNSYISQGGTGDLYIQQNVNDKDLVFQADNGSGGTSTYLTLDGSATRINVNASGGMQFMDNIKAKFGTSGDLEIYHDATNNYIQGVTGDMYIQNGANDKDIIFRSDDGAGGQATYFYLDGSNAFTNFQLNARWQDDIKAQFGNSGDLQIYHDATNSYISDIGTGDLRISANNLRMQNADNTANYIKANNLSNVEIYFNNSKKFETTNTGIQVTGNIDLADGATRSIIGPTNSNLIIEAKPNTATEGLFFQINGSDKLSIVQNGNVGIGDTPSFKLDVNVTSDRARFKAASGDANIELSSIAGHDWLIQSKSDSSLAIYDEDEASERMRLTSAGALAFGGATNYGTSGQVLTSNGNAAPTWADAAGGVPFILGGANFGSSLKVGDTTTGTLNNAEYNVGVGVLSLDAITSADSCVAVGWGSGGNITSGSDNVVIGSIAGNGVSTGQNNVNVGAKSGQSGDTNYNTGVGARTLRFGDAGADNNVAVGFSAGISNKGAQNTILGAQAGGNLTTGANNTIVGYDAEPSSGTASNEITLGNSSVSVIRAAVTSITSLSDERDKKDIKDITYGLDFVSKLQPREFVWDNRVEKKSCIR